MGFGMNFSYNIPRRESNGEARWVKLRVGDFSLPLCEKVVHPSLTFVK